jgi:hypothetical protein
MVMAPRTKNPADLENANETPTIQSPTRTTAMAAKNFAAKRSAYSASPLLLSRIIVLVPSPLPGQLFLGTSNSTNSLA